MKGKRTLQNPRDEYERTVELDHGDYGKLRMVITNEDYLRVFGSYEPVEVTGPLVYVPTLNLGGTYAFRRYPRGRVGSALYLGPTEVLEPEPGSTGESFPVRIGQQITIRTRADASSLLG